MDIQNGCQGTHSESLESYLGSSDGVKLNEPKVIKADIDAGNGVIHVTDMVPIPKQQ